MEAHVNFKSLAETGVVPNPFPRDVTGLPEASATDTVELRDGDAFELRAAPVGKRIGNAEVKMLAYNGSIPGPTLKVRQNSEVTVHFTSELELETTVHWHGLRIDNRYDGVPEGHHHGMQPPIPTGGGFTYKLRFPDVGVFWYHPHIREDYTQELGLYGNIVVVPERRDYWAPANREYALILDDILIEGDKIAPFSQTLSNHSAMGRFGNVMLLNGETEGKLQVKHGEVVRLYLTNAANVRPFNVRIPGARMKLVGSDCGRVEREVFVEEVLIAPSERAVIDVLFERVGVFPLEHRTPGKSYRLGAVEVSEEPVEISYRVAFETLRYNPEFATERASLAADFDRIPDKMLVLIGEMPGMTHGAHPMEPIEWEDTMPLHNRLTTPKNMLWKLVDEATARANHDIDWTFKMGDRVKVRIDNTPHSDHPMQHPIHFHGQRFLVLSRDGVRNDNLMWKDTVLLRAGEVVDLLVEMSNPGAWMVHCHIAEHLESGMMFTFHVH
jgi:FtsP/CotA-like multicopper oxidase with cupredoxin domain